jgi:hypothetical protein
MIRAWKIRDADGQEPIDHETFSKWKLSVELIFRDEDPSALLGSTLEESLGYALHAKNLSGDYGTGSNYEDHISPA